MQSLAQTFSVSIATAPLDEKTHADPGSRIGVGFRTQVWNGEPNAELEERVAELETINGTILDNLAQGLPIDEQRLEGTDKGAGNSGPGC